MKNTKAEVLRLIEKLPDDVTLDEVMAELYARSKIDRGLDLLEKGESVGHERVKERLKRWES